MSGGKIATLEDFKTDVESRRIELPSGKEIRILHNPMMPMFIADIVPLALLAKVQAAQEEIKADPSAATKEENMSLLERYQRLMKFIADIIVQPKFTVPDLAYLSKRDMEYIVAYAMHGKETSALAAFRAGATGTPAGDDVQQIQRTAV